MDKRDKVIGSYEIFRQKEGLGPQYVITLNDRRDVENFLTYRAAQDRKNGYRTRENKCGGFTSYTRKRVGNKPTMVPQVHYWFETVMGEEPDLDEEILTRIAEAMILGAIDGRAKREAINAGIEFEPNGEG